MKENNVEASFDRPRNLHNDLIKHEQISNEQDEMSLALLPPDHPLLAKFQQSLKEFLLRAKDQLMNEIEEIKYSVKQKEQQREEQGATLYDKQQEILRQNDKLEEYAQQIQETVQQRHCEEEAVRHIKAEYEEKAK
ncbi:Coiled-coil domain-containing protein 40 [Eumeta japonica]|uniref:Coiled-coil domain-containing protein 40 n=1 Tax=Eumeta variegata TaxID=151549 RepID=A0A4C1TQB0_EUMVA|nr:Coiled-coil domain-containing protein 40 [Eumeta japonica]